MHVEPHYTHRRAEGGDLHYAKLQIATYWGSNAFIIPSIPEVLEVPANCLLTIKFSKLMYNDKFPLLGEG